MVLSHAHQWVSSDVILKKVFFFSLVMGSPGGPDMVKLPKNALQHGDSCVVNFWRETKNSANWCAQQS